MRYETASAAQVHPSVQTLALYATRDLPWMTRFSVARHIRRCTECEQQVALFRSAKSELRREATLRSVWRRRAAWTP